ncbi:MAG: hypothetical protein II969_18100 [Anaerolineaceae bacterium]|nr:hypothetical protein [Anaerolineaceae bacterium]
MKWNFLIFHQKKKDRWINFRICEENLQRLNLRMGQVSVRLTDASHLFVSGMIQRSNVSNIFIVPAVNIVCQIENADGNILMSVRDNHTQNIELNPSAPFFLAIYSISRFLFPDDIDHVVLSCDRSDETRTGQ